MGDSIEAGTPTGSDPTGDDGAARVQEGGTEGTDGARWLKCQTKSSRSTNALNVSLMKTRGVLPISCPKPGRLSLKMSQTVRFQAILPSLLCALVSWPWSVALLGSPHVAAVKT